MALSIKQQALFLQILGDMLEGGFSIKKSLDAIMENSDLSVYAENIYENYHGGMEFVDALAEEEIFDDEIIVILRSSISENLVKGIRESQKWLQMRINFEKSVISAIIYPAVLLGVSHIVFYAIIIYIVPRLERGILSTVKEVGGFLQAYMYLSHHLLITVVCNILLIAAIFLFVRTGLFYNLLFHIPGVSRALKIRASAMFFTILSILVEAGLSITEALKYAITVKGFEKYSDNLKNIQNTGIEQFFMTMYENGKFDSVAHTTIQSGIASGSFESSVSKVAERESLRFEEIQKNLTRIIEPVVVAGTIASIAALVTPLYASILNAVFSAMERF